LGGDGSYRRKAFHSSTLSSIGLSGSFGSYRYITALMTRRISVRTLESVVGERETSSMLNTTSVYFGFAGVGRAMAMKTDEW